MNKITPDGFAISDLRRTERLQTKRMIILYQASALRLILKSEDKGIRVKKRAYQSTEFQVYFLVESS